MVATSVCPRCPTGMYVAARTTFVHSQFPSSELFGDKYTAKTTGGFVVYYVSPGKGQVTAFKPVSTRDGERGNCYLSCDV